MRILSRYLVSQFLLALFFSFIAFLGIFIIVDLIEHLDTFIDKRIPLLLVVTYYLYFAPYTIVLTLPVAMLLASMFSVGQLARNNELCAMKASGLSLYRAFIPIFALSFGISLLVLVLGEKVVPDAMGRAVRIKKGGVVGGTSRPNVALRDEGGRIIYVRYYNATQKTGRDVDISMGDPGQATLTERIVAKQMVWKNNEWVLKNGKIHKFIGDKEEVTPFDSLRAGKLITFAPLDFAKHKKLPEEMDYFELKAYIRKTRTSGRNPTKWIVESHLKLSFPFANLIIVLFGAPLSSTMRRTGKAFGFGLSLVICFVYYGTIRTTQSLGWNGVLPPFAAAWIGNAIFGVLGIILLIKVPK